MLRNIIAILVSLAAGFLASFLVILAMFDSTIRSSTTPLSNLSVLQGLLFALLVAGTVNWLISKNWLIVLVTLLILNLWYWVILQWAPYY